VKINQILLVDDNDGVVRREGKYHGGYKSSCASGCGQWHGPAVGIYLGRRHSARDRIRRSTEKGWWNLVFKRLERDNHRSEGTCERSGCHPVGVIRSTNGYLKSDGIDSHTPRRPMDCV
jgi:hypothetical protein